MSWLDPLLAIKTQQAGTTVGTRQTINFSSGATVTDDPANDRVNVAISATPADASTTVKGIVQLAGDIAGTATSVTVAKVNGVSVSGTPTAGQALVASSASAASWQQPGWYTAYEIDFTTQAPQSFTTTGSKTIGGYAWDLNNIGANSTTALSAANGLLISTPNGVASQYTRWFSPNFSTLAGAGVLKSFDMQIWCYIEPNLPAGGTYAQLRISPQDDAGGANYVAVADMGYPTTGVGGTAGINVHPWMAFGGNFYPASIATGYSQGGVSATGPNVFALCFRSQMDFDLYTGTYSGGWPTLDTMTFRNTVRPSAISFAGSASVVAGPALNAFRLMYQLQTQSTTGTCTTYFKRFRVLTR